MTDARRIKQTASPATAVGYVELWQALIDAAPDPRALLDRRRSERDQRDKLAMPIVQRLELLKQIAPKEVADTPLV
jgi:hypothetical protein